MGGDPDDSVIRHAHIAIYHELPHILPTSRTSTSTTAQYPNRFTPLRICTPTSLESTLLKPGHGHTNLPPLKNRPRQKSEPLPAPRLPPLLAGPLPLLPPAPATRARTHIPSTVSKHPGAITLYFFTATGTLLSPGEDEETTHIKRPLLINFHGGGFAIGHPLDDAWWMAAVLAAHRDAVAVSVGYRLAPEHPFPIPMEDGVDAVIWLWEHAGQYRLDRGRFVLCGESAGGNICLTVPLRLREELIKRRERSGEAPGVKLAGLIGFYPSTDWSRSRMERDATNPIASKKSMISLDAFKFFDESYLMPENLPRTGEGNGEIDMSHPYVSPGLAPEGLILAAYPRSVAIYTCGWDQLLVEGNVFRERLKGMVGPGGGASLVK